MLQIIFKTAIVHLILLRNSSNINIVRQAKIHVQRDVFRQSHCHAFKLLYTKYCMTCLLHWLLWGNVSIWKIPTTNFYIGNIKLNINYYECNVATFHLFTFTKDSYSFFCQHQMLLFYRGKRSVDLQGFHKSWKCTKLVI